MQNSSFFDKMSGKGEIPISRMQDLRAPTDDEKEKIDKMVNSKLLKNTITSIFWMLCCIFFIIIYFQVYISSSIEARKIILVVITVFTVLILISLYRIFFIDTKIRKSVKEHAYKVNEVTVHHKMPDTLNIRKANVKIQDKKMNVYNHEFILDSAQTKLYKKASDTIFILVSFSDTKKLYTILYLQN